MSAIFGFLNRIYRWFINLFAGSEKPHGGSGDFNDYYGCPNSNKARKLQTKRKYYKI